MYVYMAGTQGNVGARPMGSGVQWARGGALMRVQGNTKYTKHNINNMHKHNIHNIHKYALMRVKTNTKCTNHNFHISWCKA